MKPKFWMIIISFIIGILVCLVVVVRVVQPTNKVVETWKQPNDIKYGGNTYCLSVMEGGLDISNLPFFTERQYIIFVGVDIGKPSYGHVLNVTFYPDANTIDDVPAYIKQSKVEWSNDGVTFTEKDGDQIFIPKSSFIDTR